MNYNNVKIIQNILANVYIDAKVLILIAKNCMLNLRLNNNRYLDSTFIMKIVNKSSLNNKVGRCILEQLGRRYLSTQLTFLLCIILWNKCSFYFILIVLVILIFLNNYKYLPIIIITQLNFELSHLKFLLQFIILNILYGYNFTSCYWVLSCFFSYIYIYLKPDPIRITRRCRYRYLRNIVISAVDNIEIWNHLTAERWLSDECHNNE